MPLPVTFMSDILEDPELMQTPRASPVIVDYSFSYTDFHGKKNHLHSFIIYHWFKVSRGMVSVPFLLLHRKEKNTDVIGGAKARFQLSPSSSYPGPYFPDPFGKPHSIQSTGLHLTRQEIPHSKGQLLNNSKKNKFLCDC